VLQECRVFVTTLRVIAYQGREFIARVLDVPLERPVEASRGTLPLNGSLELHTAEGRLLLNREQGCGCHSPLKALSAPVPWTSG
jgi:hypothetical protein